MGAEGRKKVNRGGGDQTYVVSEQGTNQFVLVDRGRAASVFEGLGESTGFGSALKAFEKVDKSS